MNKVERPRLQRCLATLAVIALFAVPPQGSAGALAVFSGAGSLSATVVAQQDGGPLTPEDVVRIRSVGQVVVSPAGSHVAFTLSVPRVPFQDEDGPAWAELHVLDVASGGSRTFVGGQVNVSGIDWTPDGTTITYRARRPGDDRTSLYAIALSGGESKKVLEHETSIGAYSLSPDGSQIAFLATEPSNPRYAELAEQGVKTEVYEEELRFSRVWIAPIDLMGAASAVSTTGPARQLPIEGHVSAIEWAPSGERLAVVVAPTPLVDDSYMLRRVRVVDAQSGTVLARIENPGKLGQVAWSPDGEHLAMVSAEDISDPMQGRLMVVPSRGGDLVDLVPGYEGHMRDLYWQDAGTLTYLAAQGVYTAVAEVAIDGSGRRTLIEPGGTILAGLSVSRDGRTFAFSGDTQAHPNEVFVASAGGAPTRMTDSNPWLAARQLARQEMVEWEARDGLRVEGLLVHPLDERSGERYPLIVTVHGGPESHYDQGWLTSYSMPGQVAAGRGFAVFYPNYRASTGRGVEFSKMDHEDTAGGEFDDIVDGVDYLIDTGLVDRDRVGVTGGSYGGYATAWLTTRYSDRFAAGVMFVGISNQISKVGTSDIPNEMYEVHQRLRPWDDWEFFLDRSPIYWAGQSKTPLLIAHGKEDPRVYPGQSMEMYRNLKLRGEAPVRLIWYPGEGHGNRNAGARYDYSLRQLRWMEHYLVGPGGEKPPFEIEYPLEKKEPAKVSVLPQ
jgi:dipeptidyl aminopeptidase/acylaminoacyl peptidase